MAGFAIAGAATAILGAVIAIGWAGADWLKARAKAPRGAAR